MASEQLGAITLPEYFFQVRGRHGPAVRVVGMLIIVFFFSFYVAAQFIGAGKVLDVTFGIDPGLGMPLAAVVVVVYTMMGGFTAVCYTDVVQAVLMIVTLVVMPIIGLVLISQNGLDIAGAMRATGETASLTGGETGWAAAAGTIGGLSWGLHYVGQPQLVTKFMAIDRPEAVIVGRRVAMAWTVLAYAGATLIGIVGITLAHHGVLGADDTAAVALDQERILPVLARHLFPAWLAGILIAGAVAAMMSTADSQLLVTTSTVVEDLWSRALRRETSQRTLVLMSRLVTLVVGLAAYLLAITSDDLIYDVVSLAWAGLGSSFGPALLLSLHWRRMNGAGVLAGMVTGALSTVVWMVIPGLDDLVSVRFVAFALALVAAVVGARLGEKTRPETA